MPANLSVNLNAIALLRNRRDMPWPSVTEMGAVALEAGAAGLTVHPRPDQRHIRFSDVPAVRALIDDRFPGREFNIEGFPDENFIQLCIANEPDQVTLVPDDPEQSTSDHGWDFPSMQPFLVPLVRRFRDAGIRVSLFANPDPGEKAIEAAAASGAQRIELFTGPFGACYDRPEQATAELEKLARTALSAAKVGLEVNAGHDLTVANLPPLARAIPRLREVSIGHGLTADALVHGMAETVRRYMGALG
jgi:pyridoxine 5-phosphate synthase